MPLQRPRKWTLVRHTIQSRGLSDIVLARPAQIKLSLTLAPDTDLGEFLLDLEALAAKGVVSALQDGNGLVFKVPLSFGGGCWHIGPAGNRKRLSDYADVPGLHVLNDNEYECALVECLTREFSSAQFRTEPTSDLPHYVAGRHSAARRQVDAAVYRLGEAAPVLVAEAKWHKRTIDVKIVESFIGMLDDVGARVGLLVAHRGFSKAARSRVKQANIDLRILLPSDALRYHWLRIARRHYPRDWAFHPELSAVLRAVTEGDDSGVVAELLEPLPFEEWTACFRYAIGHQPEEARRLGEWIAAHHHDDGWRYNALQNLAEGRLLSIATAQRLLDLEADPETREYLESVLVPATDH